MKIIILFSLLLGLTFSAKAEENSSPLPTEAKVQLNCDNLPEGATCPNAKAARPSLLSDTNPPVVTANGASEGTK
jgi:hypothetical protein